MHKVAEIDREPWVRHGALEIFSILIAEVQDAVLHGLDWKKTRPIILSFNFIVSLIFSLQIVLSGRSRFALDFPT